MGYGAATVRDIIRATPLASGTFYNYFKSKEEVYEAIQNEVALVIRPRLREERHRAATVEEFISGTFRTFFEFVTRDEMNFRNLRHSADTTRVRMDTPEVIAGFEELREDLERAIARGLFPPVDADYLMASIVGVAFEMTERLLRQAKPRSRRRRRVCHRALHGRRARASAPRRARPRMKTRDLPGQCGRHRHAQKQKT